MLLEFLFEWHNIAGHSAQQPLAVSRQSLAMPSHGSQCPMTTLTFIHELQMFQFNLFLDAVRRKCTPDKV